MTRPLTAEEAMERARELGPGWCVQDSSMEWMWFPTSHEPEVCDYGFVPGYWGTRKYCKRRKRLGPGTENPDWRNSKMRVKPPEPSAAMKCGQHREQKEEA